MAAEDARSTEAQSGGGGATRSRAPTRTEDRVVRAAEAALADQRYVCAVDIFIGLGWLAPSHVDAWRQGRIRDLETVVTAGLGKVSTALRTFELSRPDP